MNFTLIQFKHIFKDCREPDQWQPLMSDVLSDWTKEQTAAFLAQTAHESAQFNILQENLNYGARGLLVTFGKYFTPEQAADYERQPARIGNRVYANRMGNGDELSGDGFKYRGRGILQVTGKNNYRACSLALFSDENILLKNPELLLEKPNALNSALWFWNSNNLKSVTDFETLTRRINGGVNGLADRQKYYSRALSIL